MEGALGPCALMACAVGVCWWDVRLGARAPVVAEDVVHLHEERHCLGVRVVVR